MRATETFKIVSAAFAKFQVRGRGPQARPPPADAWPAAARSHRRSVRAAVYDRLAWSGQDTRAWGASGRTHVTGARCAPCDRTSTWRSSPLWGAPPCRAASGRVNQRPVHSGCCGSTRTTVLVWPRNLSTRRSDPASQATTDCAEEHAAANLSAIAATEAARQPQGVSRSAPGTSSRRTSRWHSKCSAAGRDRKESGETSERASSLSALGAYVAVRIVGGSVKVSQLTCARASAIARPAKVWLTRRPLPRPSMIVRCLSAATHVRHSQRADTRACAHCEPVPTSSMRPSWLDDRSSALKLTWSSPSMFRLYIAVSFTASAS
jgi:hypothetical protein